MNFPESSSTQSTVKNTVDEAVSVQTELPAQPVPDVMPPVGITPPQLLAREAAEGRRGAAWRLLYLLMEDNPQAIVAIESLEDDRLAQHLLEFIALGNWAGKPFVVPPPLRSPYARIRLRTLFLPREGLDSLRSERVLMRAVRDKRPAVRETAAYLLGVIESPAAATVLIEALKDPVEGVRIQAARALGHTRNASAVYALLNALSAANEQLSNQIFHALVHMGPIAVQALIDRSTSGSAWVRWHCLQALGEICDVRALPVLVRGLTDRDHAVAWVAAKGLVHYGRGAVEPLLSLLLTTETSPWLVETASYVLRHLCSHNPKLKEYLVPVMQAMQGVAYTIATPQAAQKALAQLKEDGLLAAM